MLNSILVILCLIAVSAFFSISEISLAASRKIKLKLLADDGNINAQRVLKMQENPGMFFTVVQIGLNAVAILGGIVGDAAFSPAFYGLLSRYLSPELSEQLSFIISFTLVTSLFILFADLTPKRIGMIAPEAVALRIINPMRFCLFIFRPLVWLFNGMGCATLTKGPVGSIFPCVCIGLYQLLRGRSFWKTFFLLLLVGILSLIPYAAWAGAAYAQGGQSFVDLMLEENTGRFMGKMSYGSHENPIWYNFLTVIWGWIPWTLVLLISLFGLKWKNMRVLPEGTSFGERIGKAWKKFRSQSPLQLFTWVVILFIFIFYCIPKSKRSVYLLPIYPFMAVLIAEYLLALVQRGAKVFKISAHIFASLCLILTVTFIAVRLGLIPDSLFGTGRHAAENVSFMHALEAVSLSIPKWCLVALPLIAAACTWMGVAKRAGAYSLLYSIAGCMLCLFVSLDGVYQPTVLAVKSDKHLVNQIREYVPQGTVYSYDGMSFYCANFYMNDQMRHFEKDLPSGEGYVVLPERGKELLFEEFGNTYDFEEIFLTKKRSCDLRDEIYMYKFKKK